MSDEAAVDAYADIIADLAWAAGFFDGEGSVNIKSQGKTVVLSVHVAQVDRRPLDKLVRCFGGKVYGPYKSNNPRHSDHYQWVLSSHNAYKFLVKVAPYLVNKREEALIGLEYQQFFETNRRPGVKTPDAIWLAREQFKTRLKEARYGRAAR